MLSIFFEALIPRFDVLGHFYISAPMVRQLPSCPSIPYTATHPTEPA
jgi:hypothetical protein